MPLALAVDQRGILPDEMIGALIRDGAILAEYEFVQDQIQPASLDLRLGEIAFRVRASFLPGPNTTVAERIDDLKLHEIALTDGAVLETGCVYIVPLIESLALPDNIVAAANPKSSTGRLDVFTRVIADETRGFDRISAGYHGPLYAEISPKTFPVLVREGSRLSQIRFRHGNAHLDAGGVARAAQGRAAGRRRRCRRGRGRRGERRSRRPRAGRLRGLPRQAPHRPDRRRPPRRLRRRRVLGADQGAQGREPGARSRRVLHPGVEGSGAGAARLRRRDGAVRSAGRRVPRALRRVLRSRLRLRRRRRARRARGARGALARGAVHPRARPDRRPPGLRAHAEAAEDRSTARASARTTRRRA